MSITITIIETGKTKELSMIDTKTGCDYVGDFINWNDFTFDDDDNITCDMDTYNWWRVVCRDNEALEERIDKLKAKHDHGPVHDAISYVSVDLEDHARAVNSALNDAFGTD